MSTPGPAAAHPGREGGIEKENAVSGPQHPLPYSTRPSAQPLKARVSFVEAAQLHLGWFYTPAIPASCTRGISGVVHEGTGLSRQYWVPSSSSCYHKLSQTPTGCRSSKPRAVPEVRSFLPLFPGLCGRQELQHDALQSAGAPDTRNTLCEQGGHWSTFKSSPNEPPS